jgi:hypothetical protein
LNIEDWDRAEIDYPNWREHILKVKNADLSYPIWICNIDHDKNTGKRIEVIFDGIHRYTKAVMEKKENILTKKIRFEDIPEEYFC